MKSADLITPNTTPKQAADIVAKNIRDTAKAQQTAPKAEQTAPTAQIAPAAQKNGAQPPVNSSAKPIAPMPATAQGAKNAPVEGANTRLTEEDLDAYMNVGDRLHVKDQKARVQESYGSPVLTKAAEIAGFIRDSVAGKIRNAIKAYGRVGTDFANRVARVTNGEVDISNYYLELDANKLAHISDHIKTDKDSRNIPLTAEQVEQIPEYIDTFDDLIDVIRRKDGSVRLMLGKKINGHSIIIEAVSKGRSALHPITAYQVSTEDYNSKYKTRAIDRSSTSRPANADTVDISRPAIAPVAPTVSQNGTGVKPIGPVRETAKTAPPAEQTERPIGPVRADGTPVTTLSGKPVGPVREAKAAEENAQPAASASTETSRYTEEELTDRAEALREEMEANEKLRDNALKRQDAKIAKLQAEYDARKDKTTRAAENILRKIERQKRLKKGIDSDYSYRIKMLADGISRAEKGYVSSRAELHENIVESVKESFEAADMDLDDVLKGAKDLPTLSTVDSTPQRVMERALGYKAGQLLADVTVNKVAQNETEGIKWLNSFTDRKDGVLAQLSKKYGIKPGSKESAAAQMYAEGFYVADNNDIIEYGDNELAARSKSSASTSAPASTGAWSRSRSWLLSAVWTKNTMSSMLS